MKRLQYAKLVNLGQLRDELIAAFPETDRPLAVEGALGVAWVTVPDQVPDTAVAAVVNAHVAAPAPPPVFPPVPAQFALLRSIGAGTNPGTLADAGQALRALIALYRHRFGDF